MTLAKLSNNWFPSAPSIFDRFFDGELMDWNRTNYSSTDTTLPAVNVKENDNEFLIDVAAPGLKKEDFKVNYDNGRLTISSEKKNEKEEQQWHETLSSNMLSRKLLNTCIRCQRRASLCQLFHMISSD